MRICLILEGSYPYTHGGVSSWMHQFITAMPEHEFILWTIGAKAADRGKFFYELPGNVTEIHELFLDDALKVRAVRGQKFHLTPEQIQALSELMDCGRPDWEELFRLYQEQHMNPAGFLMSEAFLDILSIASGSRCVCNADGKELAGRCSCDCGAWCILWSAFHPSSSASGDTGTGVPAACSGSGGDRSIFGLQL